MSMCFLFSQIKKTKNKITRQAGFTVIELIVIISIFAIMASVSIYNFQGFDDSTNINNLALDIALEIKRAQTLGSSSIDTPGTIDKSAMSVIFTHDSNDTFKPELRVVREFPTLSSAPSGQLGQITNNDTVDRSSEIFGGTIERICLTDVSSTTPCDPVGDDIAISFRRPYTDPIVTLSSCLETVQDIRSNVLYTNVCLGQTVEIQLTSRADRKRTIIIEPTGNIYTRIN